MALASQLLNHIANSLHSPLVDSKINLSPKIVALHGSWFVATTTKEPFHGILYLFADPALNRSDHLIDGYDCIGDRFAHRYGPINKISVIQSLFNTSTFPPELRGILPYQKAFLLEYSNDLEKELDDLRELKKFKEGKESKEEKKEEKESKEEITSLLYTLREELKNELTNEFLNFINSETKEEAKLRIELPDGVKSSAHTFGNERIFYGWKFTQILPVYKISEGKIKYTLSFSVDKNKYIEVWSHSRNVDSLDNALEEVKKEKKLECVKFVHEIDLTNDKVEAHKKNIEKKSKLEKEIKELESQMKLDQHTLSKLEELYLKESELSSKTKGHILDLMQYQEKFRKKKEDAKMKMYQLSFDEMFLEGLKNKKKIDEQVKFYNSWKTQMSDQFIDKLPVSYTHATFQVRFDAYSFLLDKHFRHITYEKHAGKKNEAHIKFARQTTSNGFIFDAVPNPSVKRTYDLVDENLDLDCLP